jgi:hypothetical protein
VARLDANRRQFASLALGAAFAAGGARADALIRTIHDASRLGTSESFYIPPTSLTMIADIYRRMTAPVRIQGQGPFAFVVDTGANQSVISEELAARLKLPIGPTALLNGVAGVQPAPTTTAIIGLGRNIERRARLFVLPSAAIGGDGMLGLDGLEGQKLTFDFRYQRLTIEPGGRPHRDPFDITVKATRRDGQLTLIDADLTGIAITAFIDSGAQDTIGNIALESMAMPRHSESSWTSTAVVSVTGQTIQAQMADLPDLRIGGLRLPTWPVAFADLHTFNMWNLTDRPAILLGVDVLSRFEQVCLDFAHDEVRFRLPDAESVWLAKR